VHHNEETRSYIYTPGFEKNIDMYIMFELINITLEMFNANEIYIKAHRL